MCVGVVDGVRVVCADTDGGTASVYSAEGLQEDFVVLVLDRVR